MVFEHPKPLVKNIIPYQFYQVMRKTQEVYYMYW